MEPIAMVDRGPGNKEFFGNPESNPNPTTYERVTGGPWDFVGVTTGATYQRHHLIQPAHRLYPFGIASILKRENA